jgi:UDP-glucose 4-epimerase
MRVLVTGCAGFIGSHLSERLITDGHEVVGVDCFVDYYPRAFKESNLARLLDESAFSFRNADLLELDAVRLLDGIDRVYHHAAQPGVRGSWGREFQTYVRNNLLVTQHLLEAAIAHRDQLTKFVYASSSSIYGNVESFPTSESLRPEPVSPYGVTKLAGEQLAHLYWHTYGVPTVALRYFTVYGPRQRPDMAFHRFIRAALRNEPLHVFGSGAQTRDFTFVADVVEANVAAGDSLAVGTPFNIGGGSRVSINNVIELLGRLVGRELEVNYLPVERGDVRDTSADTFNARKAFGFTPRVELASGLAAELEWMEAYYGGATEKMNVSQVAVNV